MADTSWILWGLALAVVAYLVRINYLLSQVPEEIEKVVGPRWTPEKLKETYKRIQEEPFDYTGKLPPRLDRRYIVTGGSGLVGGYIVQQLLARGTPPSAIRILDIRRSERPDLQRGPAAAVGFARADITSAASVRAAFARPWPDPALQRLPLTVFHAAAVILAAERAAHAYPFAEAVNVRGTAHVLAAARDAADAATPVVFSATSSASIAIRPVGAWAAPWRACRRGARPRNFAQVLDTADFFSSSSSSSSSSAAPPRRGGEPYFGVYAASKAAGERLVCAAHDGGGGGFRTGTLRPANGVYGAPGDNTVGDGLARRVLPSWAAHVVQPFAHGANVAAAHLAHEAALLLDAEHGGGGGGERVAARPFVVADPNPPVRYADLYAANRALCARPFRLLRVPPVLVLLLAHALEAYADFRAWAGAAAAAWLPPLSGDLVHLKPAMFSIVTHLVADDRAARLPVAQGGIGYVPLMDTMEGVAREIFEWNQELYAADAAAEAAGEGGKGGVRMKKAYTTSISLAESIRKGFVDRKAAAGGVRGDVGLEFSED
ncbi:NAD(P)-binding protein [Xylariomycetidae sp. FL0641]|nr:NAD(P)-binding protein [Xylariomycetidae sp. FL0641]